MFSNREKHSIKLSKSASHILAGSALVFALAVWGGFAPQQALAGVESDPRLVKLEMKFFQHDYSKEDVQTRLQRLEKMVFGDSRSGDPQTRLQNLVSAVPNLDEAANQAEAAPATTASRPSAPPPSRRTQSAPNDDADIASREQQITGSSDYPQVSAMEKKLFRRDYAGEALAKRLDRLETTVYGKPSASSDLSDRVDRLKARTGIDLAASPPPGTDWADDDDDAPRGGGDITYVPAETTPFANTHMPHRSGNSSGTYGGGGNPYSDTDATGGTYGSRPPATAGIPTTGGGMPPVAPSVVPGGSRGLGLSQQVSVLENEVFRKTYPNDPLPARINRLESTVFRGTVATGDMSLPERVSRLSDVIGSGSSDSRNARKRVAQRRSVDDDMDDPDMPPTAPPRSGLSKIMGGLGNLIGGGNSGNGTAYPMGSHLVTDPRTGMLVDMYTGNIIDPRTGAVVGNQATGVAPGTFGALPYSGGGCVNGFNNGLSPMGSAYGSGMRFGTGFGGMRMGGMGFGTGMGMGGMGLGGMGGIWP